jgi:aminoglycoside phosphotransferase (APT) family kinase protein
MTYSINESIEQAVQISRLSGYTGNYEPLGGGEINDTYILDCGENKYILRISKYVEQNSLLQEARALKMLDVDRIPKLIYFEANKRIAERQWIIESYISGLSVNRLNEKQYSSLGSLLAQVHATKYNNGVNIWGCFLDECKMFGDEKSLKNHVDTRLKKIVNISFEYFQEWQPTLDSVNQSLIHGDATPSNALVNGDEVSLIDWEFSKFKDPMAEFSTIYYDDMEYNQGKWRTHITEDEKDALFSGYIRSGGKIDEERIKLWMNFDKLGAAIFLYWRINQSNREATEEQMKQYRFDLNNLIESLEKNLLK